QGPCWIERLLQLRSEPPVTGPAGIELFHLAYSRPVRGKALLDQLRDQLAMAFLGLPRLLLLAAVESQKRVDEYGAVACERDPDQRLEPPSEHLLFHHRHTPPHLRPFGRADGPDPVEAAALRARVLA